MIPARWLFICSTMRLSNLRLQFVAWGCAGGAGGSLTAREIEVLRYLALGWDIANIATELGLSPHTVRNHSTNLRRKLDVRSSLEAVMVAMRLGILRSE